MHGPLVPQSLFVVHSVIGALVHLPGLYGYGRPLNASTHAEMCVNPRSGVMLMSPRASEPANNALALIGAPSALLNLFTKAPMSAKSGCVVAEGGFNGSTTSPQRVVETGKDAETAAQLTSLP